MTTRNADRFGEGNPRARLTEDQAVQIHTLACRGKLRKRDIAAYYGVDRRMVRLIQTGQRWVHLGLVAPIAPATGRTGLQAQEIDGNGHVA